MVYVFLDKATRFNFSSQIRAGEIKFAGIFLCTQELGTPFKTEREIQMVILECLNFRQWIQRLLINPRIIIPAFTQKISLSRTIHTPPRLH